MKFPIEISLASPADLLASKAVLEKWLGVVNDVLSKRDVKPAGKKPGPKSPRAAKPIASGTISISQQIRNAIDASGKQFTSTAIYEAFPNNKALVKEIMKAKRESGDFVVIREKNGREPALYEKRS